MDEPFTDTRIVTNPGPNPLEVWFEPWGKSHSLAPGESFRVEGRSPQSGQMEVVESDGSLAVYGWPGSTLRVYNDKVLVDEFSIGFPELPPGMSFRTFVEVMFGGPGGPGRDAEPNAAASNAVRMNHAKLTFVGTVTTYEDADVFRLQPAPVSVRQLTFLNFAYTMITASVIWAIDGYAEDFENKQQFIILIAIWMFLVAVAVSAFTIYTHRRELRRGPWLTFYKASQEFELPRVGQRFRRDEVLEWRITTTWIRHTRWHEYPLYDHWLITQHDGTMQRWHVLNFNANLDCDTYTRKLQQVTSLNVVRVNQREQSGMS